MIYFFINIDDLLRQRSVEGERIEYKTGGACEVVLHTIGAIANDFHNLGGGYAAVRVAVDSHLGEKVSAA